jgi:hypothetical protein
MVHLGTVRNLSGNGVIRPLSEFLAHLGASLKASRVENGFLLLKLGTVSEIEQRVNCALLDMANKLGIFR